MGSKGIRWNLKQSLEELYKKEEVIENKDPKLHGRWLQPVFLERDTPKNFPEKDGSRMILGRMERVWALELTRRARKDPPNPILSPHPVSQGVRDSLKHLHWLLMVGGPLSDIGYVGWWTKWEITLQKVPGFLDALSMVWNEGKKISIKGNGILDTKDTNLTASNEPWMVCNEGKNISIKGNGILDTKDTKLIASTEPHGLLWLAPTLT